MIDGMRAAALPLSAAMLGLGVAAAGFLAYNKVDDLKEWVADQWEDGFGLVNDPAQTQEQVSTYSSPNRTPAIFAGMSASSIYTIHYDMRDDLLQYFSRLYAEQIGWEQFRPEDPFTWNGQAHEWFKQYVWHYGPMSTNLSAPDVHGTYRYERPEVIQVQGEDVNEISEYVYQMIIRETDSRNTQARITSGLLGAASTGIGLAASEGIHWMLRSSGFMRGSDGWDGQNWEEAPGANLDPLLMYAWGRTDFQTGKWWSTVDSQGDVAFWLDVMDGKQGGTKDIQATFSNPEYSSTPPIWSYEQIIYYAHQEMQDGAMSLTPFLQWISDAYAGIPYRPAQTTEEITAEEAQAIAEQGEREQEESSNESGRDDYMPGEEPPPDPEDQYGPPRV